MDADPNSAAAKTSLIITWLRLGLCSTDRGRAGHYRTGADSPRSLCFAGARIDVRAARLMPRGLPVAIGVAPALVAGRAREDARTPAVPAVDVAAVRRFLAPGPSEDRALGNGGGRQNRNQSGNEKTLHLNPPSMNRAKRGSAAGRARLVVDESRANPESPVGILPAPLVGCVGDAIGPIPALLRKLGGAAIGVVHRFTRRAARSGHRRARPCGARSRQQHQRQSNFSHFHLAPPGRNEGNLPSIGKD